MGIVLNDLVLSGLAQKTLVVPIVSIANIGQLAVDLLIASLDLRRIAILNPRYCVPVVGAREDGEQGVTTALELYGRPDSDLVVIQQRSPVLKVLKNEFIRAILQFIEDAKFGAVLFLSGVDLSNRTDAQMMTPTYQLLSQNTPPLTGTPLHRLSSLPIPTYSSPIRQHVQPSEENQSVPFIPGGGLTRRILSSTPEGWSIPTASLLQFVFEGDNQADAGLLASVVAKVLGMDIVEWKQPSSWRAGLFGAPHDQTLYG